MKIPKYSLNIANKPIEIISVLFCLCIVTATFIRWMNYFNAIAIAAMLLYILVNRQITKRPLCLLWAGYILVYPLLDAAIRGEVGINLFTALCYITPMTLLLLTDMRVDNFANLFIKFAKLFAWIQTFGIFLKLISERLFTMIAYHVLGMWTYTVTGFTIDATVAAYILCFGIAAYVIEFWLTDVKCTKQALFKIMCIVIQFAALVLTGKRSFLVGVIAALVITLLVHSTSSVRKFEKTFWTSVFVVVLGFVVCLVAYYAGMQNALGRMGETIIALFQGKDVSNMRNTWAEYMREWSQGRELFGIGWESFKNRIMLTPYGGKVPNGHNVYRQLLCEEGYVGVTIFVLLILATVGVAIYNTMKLARCRNKKANTVAMFSTFSVILFAIYCRSGNAVYDTIIYLYFFAAIQLVAIAGRERKKLFY